MYRPCDQGMCNEERCTDKSCIVFQSEVNTDKIFKTPEESDNDEQEDRE